MEYFHDNPGLFRKIKSMKFYTQISDESAGVFVQVIEFEDLTQKEILDKQLAKDEESLRFHDALMKLKDKATVKVSLWKPVVI